MISTINAQNYYGTDADFEIGYEGFTPEYRDLVSRSFRFNVNWTPISELMVDLNDRRSDRSAPINRYWVGYWLLAARLLREKKYKAVCVIQADQFVFTNLDVYFKIAEAGFLLSSEFDQNCLTVDDLAFGDERAIWDRSQCPVFDSVNFIGQEHAQFPADIVHYQEEDPFRGEASHSVIALNRALCKHGSRGKVLGLDGRTWCGDRDWHTSRLAFAGRRQDKIVNGSGLIFKAWHCRWWQPGRVQGEFMAAKLAYRNAPDKRDFVVKYGVSEHNYNVVKSFMERFNNMTPAVKSEEYVKGEMRISQWED